VNLRWSDLSRPGGALLLAAVVALVGSGGPADAAPSGKGKPVSGHLASQQVTCPPGTPGIGLCTAGRLTGGVQGAFEFALIELKPSLLPDVQLYTGRLVVHTRDGDLFCASAGAFNANPTSGQQRRLTRGPADGGRGRGRRRVERAVAPTSFRAPAPA
jgi:hypothetical protein